MKKRTKINLILISCLAIFIIFSFEFLCKLGIKCEKCNKTSSSKTESKESGFYIADYEPLSRTLKLSHHDETIEFLDIWAENKWFINSEICLFSHKEKRDGYNVIFEFQKSNENTFLFSLSPLINGKLDKTNGGIQEDKKKIRLSILPDTLWLQVHEKNPLKEIGWRNGIEGQKVGFVKK
ncbi:MAG: hypothetical protein ACRBF0_22640 [Calditrichia bacterium]